jgi:hypothetical protein
MQTVLLAATPEVKAMSMVKGLILNAAAIDANRTWLTRIQEPLAGIANLLIPLWGIVPPSDAGRYHRDPAEVCISLLQLPACVCPTVTIHKIITTFAK